MGPSVKFVLAIIDSASKKMSLKYKLSTGLLRGGGVAGPLSSKRLKKKVIFPNLPNKFS